MRDEVYFLTRYIPFWAIPLMLISLELTYLFWLRKKKKQMLVSFIIALLALFLSCFYYWAGGPEKSVKEVIKVIRYVVD